MEEIKKELEELKNSALGPLRIIVYIAIILCLILEEIKALNKKQKYNTYRWFKSLRYKKYLTKQKKYDFNSTEI